MKNQKLISRNTIRRYREGLPLDVSEFLDNKDKDAKLVVEGKMSPYEYKAKYYPNSEVVNIPGYGSFVGGKGMSGADPLLSLFVGGGRKAGLFSLDKLFNLGRSAYKNKMATLLTASAIGGGVGFALSDESDNNQQNVLTNPLDIDNFRLNQNTISTNTTDEQKELASKVGQELGKIIPSVITKVFHFGHSKLNSSGNSRKSESPSAEITTPEQKEDIAITLNEMISEILGYLTSGNKIEGLEKPEDINKLEPWQIQDVFRLIQRVYANEGTTVKEYEPGYEPKEDEKKEQLTTTIAHTPSQPLNRAEIRALIERDLGINPYSISGSKRRLLREFINGDKEQDMSWVDKNSKLYNNWIAPFVVYKNKKGGLISKNVINRFKSGGYIRKFYGGSLLTARQTFERRITNRRNTNLNTGRFDLYGDEAYTNTNTNTNNRNNTNTNNTNTSNTSTNTNTNNHNNTNRHTLRPSKALFYGTRAYGNYDNTQLELVPDNIKILLLNTGFNSDGFNDVYDFQQALNDYFAMDGDINNQILVDGKWGQLTQRAFNMAIAKAQSKFPALEEDIINNTLVPSTFTTTINPIQVLSVPNYNRALIRGLISSKGLNPYDYTGQLRRALRKYLNRESSDTSLLKGTDLEFLLNYGENK